MRLQLPLAAAVCSVLLNFNARAVTTHYVDANGTNSVAPYTSWATAATNIQDAVNYASSGDTVLVTNGVYQYGGNSVGGSNRVWTFNPILLQSVNGPAVTVIKGYQMPGTTNGAYAVRCVYLNNGATLSGFTLTNGATPNFDYGGGVKCAGTTATVTNCVIINNAAYDGGGGAYMGTLINCSLIGNSVSPANIGSGGGASQSILINCLLEHNFAGYISGGAVNSTLINCTVVSNVAAAYSGSVWGCTLNNCIVYYNFSYYTNADSNSGYSFSNCCVSFPLTGISGANNFTNPPLFANPAAGDYHLNAASPCINAGNNSFVTNATDLDGNPRIVGGIVDLGAYEFQSPVRYVNVSNTAPVSPFTNWVTAATNIQDAIDAADSGDFIVVSNGAYQTGGRVVYGAATNRVMVDKAVTVQSVNGATVTVITGIQPPRIGSGPYARCVYLTNGATLIGFTLTNGGTVTEIPGHTILELNGGGVWCEGSGAVISNCVFTGNSATRFGGGAFQGTLFNCILTNNSAAYGGGACSNMLVGCTLTKNSASGQNLQGFSAVGGGAIYCTLSNCVVTGNAASPGGGGGLSFGVAYNCVISNNTTFSNGAGACSNILYNCVLERNVAQGAGGGTFYCSAINCTIVSNTAVSGDGGGMYGGAATNCIVYYNSASTESNYDGSVALSYCCTMPSPSEFQIFGPGNITNDPAFVNPAGGDFHLQSNSPCINAGDNAYVTSTTDLDGDPRIVGGTVDIGAYEYQTPASIISYAWLQQYSFPTDGSADYADPDGDGMNNYQEWIAGTNPTNALSLLEMLNPVPTNNPAGLVVSWESVSNITYFLQSSTNLAAQPAFSTVQSNIVGQSDTTSYTDTNAVGNGPFFYRVGVQQ